jgi:hypothetical protein
MEGKMAKGDDIQERLVALAASIVAFCNKLPKSAGGSHLANQLMRSGTSPARNLLRQSRSNRCGRRAPLSQESLPQASEPFSGAVSQRRGKMKVRIAD